MRPLDTLLAPDLLRKARMLQTLGFTLQHYLPPPLNGHCWVGGVDERTLTLITDGPAWATRLRYQQQELLKVINSDFALQLNRVRIRVTPPQRQTVRPAQHRLTLSPSNARMLRETAESTADPELAQALRRLADRAAHDPAPRSALKRRPGPERKK